MSQWLKDFKNARYSLSRRPGFSGVVILTLSLTLGAFITMFTLNYTVLLKPLPYPEQDSLFVVQGERYDKGELLGTDVHSYAGSVEAYKKNQVFDESVLLHYEEQLISNLPRQPKLFTTYTTPELFKILGANMAKGRYFDSSEGLDARTPVAVISYDTWQNEYAGRSDIINHKIQIYDVSFNIIGVLGEDFIEPMLYMPGRHTKIWLPFDFNSRDEETRRNWTTGFFDLKLVGRLSRGASVQEANHYFTHSMNERYTEAVREFSYGKDASVGASLRSFEEIIVGDSRATSLMLLAGVFALLLIACANISNLFLSRAAEKQRQYAILATLGAQKYHIFRVIFIETLVLTAVSTLVALAFTQFNFSMLQEHAVEHLARLNELRLSPVILLFSVVLALLLAGVFAAIISSLIDYKSLNSILRVSGKGSGLQISKRIRDILIVSQVALAGILLCMNFTLMTNALEVIDQRPGFATEDIIAVNLDVTQDLNREERITYIETIVSKLEQMPEVRKVSNAIFPPLITNSWTSVLTDEPSGTGARSLPNMNLVDENYIPIFQLPIIAGRNFTEIEIRDSAKVIIVNETVAKEFGPTSEVLGKNLYWEDNADPYKVIGIVEDIYVPRNDFVPQMFTGRTTSLRFMISIHPNQQLSKGKINEMLHGISQSFRVASFEHVDNLYNSLLARDIAITVITIALSLLTLLLAGLGIYGVLSYGINLRTYELGVRMALGASPKIISKMIFVDSSKPIAVGLAVSVAFLFALFVYLTQQSELNISVEISAVLATFVLISATSIAACFIPLRKVVSAQPIKALK